MSRDQAIRALFRARPRSRFLRASVAALLGLALFAWLGGGLDSGQLFTERSATNFRRFLRGLEPYPLQGKPWDFAVLARWLSDTLQDRGMQAVLATLAISIAAIVLAGIGGAIFGLPAARTVASPEPFLTNARAPSRVARYLWTAALGMIRLLLVFLRAIPVYVWAFVLLGMLGRSAWPAVLALALHNTGILGKLSAEVVENLEPAPLKAMRGLGGSRAQIGFAAILPAALGRFLLYFFYRWETCVREATVLGLLGILSTGYWIRDARARLYYDEMLLFILLGVLIILVGDFVSAVARGLIRRSR